MVFAFWEGVEEGVEGGGFAHLEGLEEGMKLRVYVYVFMRKCV